MSSLKAEVDLIYGASGTGKTSAIGELAEYIFENTGKITRLVTADGGGYAPLEPYIDAGLIEVWPLTNLENPIEMMDFAVQGYWPDPVEKKYTKKGLENVGGYAFEGLTSFPELAIAHLRHKGAKLQQEPSFSFKDGQTTYFGSNMTYFGFAQDTARDFVMKSHHLGVKKIVWTALEGKGEDENTKAPIYGPALVGKKSTAKAPQWFSNCIHLEMLVEQGGTDQNKQGKVTAKPVMYLRPHADAITKIIFPAKTRAPLSLAAKVPEFLDPPSLKKLYNLLDELKAESTAAIRARMTTAKV